jgi:hypothetical protein
MKAKKLTRAGREKIVREMVKVFKEHGVLDCVSIVFNNKMVYFGATKIDWDKSRDSDDTFYIYPEPKTTINKKPEDYSGNKNTLVVIYDGGALYSCMSGEFGGDWRERVENSLERVFGPYHLGIEHIDHVSFTLVEDITPSYEQVINKLCE